MSGIWFDGRFVKPGKPDGIGQFSLGLAKELAKLTDVTVLVSSKAQADEFEGLKHFLVNSPESPSELTLAFRLRKQNIDVLFSPMQTTSSWFRNFKLVLTLHDLIYYRHRTPPSVFRATAARWHCFAAGLRLRVVALPSPVLLGR